jgi:hypothetical protein
MPYLCVANNLKFGEVWILSPCPGKDKAFLSNNGNKTDTTSIGAESMSSSNTQ